MNKKDTVAVGKTGWLPFWYGSKFNKRLAQKRLRQKYKKAVTKFGC